MKGDRRVVLGRSGERAAAAYLGDQGYRLVEKNLRSRRGEADLILYDGDTLVFCEVKTKMSLHSGHAGESYTPKQQKRLRRLILSYLQKTGWEGAVRADLVALQKLPEGPNFEVLHYKNIIDFEDNW